MVFPAGCQWGGTLCARAWCLARCHPNWHCWDVLIPLLSPVLCPPKWLRCLLLVSALGQSRLVPSPHLPRRRSMGDVLWLPRPSGLWESGFHPLPGALLLPWCPAFPGELCMPVSWPNVLRKHTDTPVLSPGGTRGIQGPVAPPGSARDCPGGTALCFSQLLKPPWGLYHPSPPRAQGPFRGSMVPSPILSPCRRGLLLHPRNLSKTTRQGKCALIHCVFSQIFGIVARLAEFKSQELILSSCVLWQPFPETRKA